MTTLALTDGRLRLGPAVVAAAGVTLGTAYTLSPLTTLSLGVLLWAMQAAGRGLSDTERRWFWCLMSVAVAVRLAAIAALFLTADAAHPFASFFGDEELYKFRTVWLRNIGQGIPISPADVIYTYDDVGRTSYMYVLAYLQALTGDAPYGLHVMNMTLYLAAVLGMYRFVRASYGSAAAMGGVIALLFLPSPAIWSISVLKEPMNVFMLVAEVMCAVAMVRAPRWWQRGLAVAGVAGFGLAMETLRGGGLLTAVVGTAGGMLLAFALARGRRLVLALVAAPLAIAALAATPWVQERALANVRSVAFYHAGHVLTPGYSYQLVDPQYYSQRMQLRNEMPPVDAARFTVAAVWSYFAEPLPWRMRSAALLAYMPEQIGWYGLALLLPFGLLAGLRRDRVLTSMLAAHGLAAILLVALTSGNIGTLIRHRALALPYLVWLSAVGAHDLIRRAVPGGAGREGSRVDGDR